VGRGQEVGSVGVVDEMARLVDVDRAGEEAGPAVGRFLQPEAVVQGGVALLQDVGDVQGPVALHLGHAELVGRLAYSAGAGVVGHHRGVAEHRQRRVEGRHVVGVGELDRAVVAGAVGLQVELGVGDVQPPVVGAGRGVVDGDVLLVVEDRVVDGPVGVVEVAGRTGGLAARGPGLAVVDRLDDVDLGERQGPEEAQLGDIEGAVAVAVGDRRVAAVTEVPGPHELGGDPGGAPAPAAVAGPHDRHAAADVVVGGGHGDQRVAGVVGDRGLVLRQRRVESSFICTLLSAGAAAALLARNCLAWAATAAGLTMARTPLELAPCDVAA
jgi:hypothetical protein